MIVRCDLCWAGSRRRRRRRRRRQTAGGARKERKKKKKKKKAPAAAPLRHATRDEGRTGAGEPARTSASARAATVARRTDGQSRPSKCTASGVDRRQCSSSGRCRPRRGRTGMAWHGMAWHGSGAQHGGSRGREAVAAEWHVRRRRAEATVLCGRVFSLCTTWDRVRMPARSAPRVRAAATQDKNELLPANPTTAPSTAYVRTVPHRTAPHRTVPAPPFRPIRFDAQPIQAAADPRRAGSVAARARRRSGRRVCGREASPAHGHLGGSYFAFQILRRRAPASATRSAGMGSTRRCAASPRAARLGRSAVDADGPGGAAQRWGRACLPGIAQYLASTFLAGGLRRQRFAPQQPWEGGPTRDGSIWLQRAADESTTVSLTCGSAERAWRRAIDGASEASPSLLPKCSRCSACSASVLRRRSAGAQGGRMSGWRARRVAGAVVGRD